MIPRSAFLFFTDKSEAGTSEHVLFNNGGDSLTVQVSGDFDSLALEIQGRTNLTAEFVPLAVLNLTEMKVTPAVEDRGLFAVMGADGCKQFRAVIQTITGGSANVYAYLVNSCGGV